MSTSTGGAARKLTLVPPPVQPIIPGTEAAKANRPFMVRCRQTKTGNADRKAIYLTLATYCDTYVDADFGRCWPGLDMLRLEAEVPRKRFFRAWRDLKAVGLVEVHRRPNGNADIIMWALPPEPTEVPVPEVPPGDHFRKFPQAITSGSSPRRSLPSTRSTARTTQAAEPPPRLTCQGCGRSWQAADGPDCHECHRPWNSPKPGDVRVKASPEKLKYYAERQALGPVIPPKGRRRKEG